MDTDGYIWIHTHHSTDEMARKTYKKRSRYVTGAREYAVIAGTLEGAAPPYTNNAYDIIPGTKVQGIRTFYGLRLKMALGLQHEIGGIWEGEG